ncbi:MAG: dCMP deaminase family protein [Alphaproteobacteria bacterium]|nr:dCMP deaminase family protein [Alphaproteobacteria bacterium]MBO7097885.1 dCMP deaminase family protein [Alphaproteobacteria bacterium]
MFSEKWNKRFMELAFLVASWSKDPSTKTGAVVVGPDKEIRATGYNGPVRGVDDDVQERFERPVKYEFFEHAERNALYNACLTGVSLKGCVMYATHAPCTDCARAIIQAGIKTVVTNKIIIDENTPKNTWRDKLIYSEQMFREAGVEYIEL